MFLYGTNSVPECSSLFSVRSAVYEYAWKFIKSDLFSGAIVLSFVQILLSSQQFEEAILIFNWA